MNRVKVPRCYHTLQSKLIRFQLHGFSEVSAQVHGVMVYLRVTYENGRVTVNIVASKTCVSNRFQD